MGCHCKAPASSEGWSWAAVHPRGVPAGASAHHEDHGGARANYRRIRRGFRRANGRGRLSFCAAYPLDACRGNSIRKHSELTNIPESGTAFLAKLLKKHGSSDNAYHVFSKGMSGYGARYGEKIPQYPLCWQNRFIYTARALFEAANRLGTVLPADGSGCRSEGVLIFREGIKRTQ